MNTIYTISREAPEPRPNIPTPGHLAPIAQRRSRLDAHKA